MDISVIRSNLKLITYYNVLIIALVHIIGYVNLREWMQFSGIGREAINIENRYGFIGIIILNAIAVLLFTVLALIYRYQSVHRVLYFLSIVIVVGFVVRGISGYILIMLDMTGTASLFWEFVFSSYALVIGITGFFGGEYH